MFDIKVCVDRAHNLNIGVMRRRFISLLVLLIVHDAHAHAERKELRTVSRTRGSRRKHIIRRLHGEENASAHKHARQVEMESSPRLQTGLPADINHIVPYANHPYNMTDPERRRLDDATSLFKPMRIHFETKALDDSRNGNNAARVDFIKQEILPRTGEFWSTALSVVPVNGNLKVSAAELRDRTYCGDSEFTAVPTEHISTGVPDSDLVLYVSGTPSSRFCAGTTLAVAIVCNFDQFDRPTAGAINFCLNRIRLENDGTASEAVIQDNVDVAVHEVAHVLGHSSNSYLLYWDSETGTPRTPRPISQTTIECVDGETRTLRLPDPNTLQFFTPPNGQRYASIVTPKVRAIARNQFDCQSLAGAPLENQPTGSGSCAGDHWEERLFYPEALSGVISPTTNVLSHLTLALMEDSGWYRANYTQGVMSPWGLGAGCEFVTEKCITTETQTGSDGTVATSSVLPSYSKGYFCLDVDDRGCSPTLSHKQACTIENYYLLVPRRLPPEPFQYFANDASLGGPRQADYCPVFGSKYSGREPEELACADTRNADPFNVNSEDYGSDSQCIPSKSGDGRCHTTACIKDEMILKIKVRGVWHKCEYDFQEIDVQVGLAGIPQTLICPRLSMACPDLFCPFMCAGRGVCNYAATVNGTISPKCECFDPSDTSPGCSDSQIPAGNFLEDSTGLVNNLEENFFDPLVAVFVDHPDKWTSSSWAWAAGLLTVVMIMILCVCSTFWPEENERKIKRAAY